MKAQSAFAVLQADNRNTVAIRSGPSCSSMIVSAKRTYFSDCAAIEAPAEKVLESLPTETRCVGAVKANIDHLVVALWGLWDLYDADVNGTRLVVGTPEWTAFMTAKLDGALDDLTARGARVAILTTPYIDAHNDRVDTLNALYRTVAARRPQQVQVVDIQPAMSYLAPQRWDGIHFTPEAADLLGRAIVPEIAKAVPQPSHS